MNYLHSNYHKRIKVTRFGWSRSIFPVGNDNGLRWHAYYDNLCHSRPGRGITDLRSCGGHEPGSHGTSGDS
jgi:hypothetical protein